MPSNLMSLVQQKTFRDRAPVHQQVDGRTLCTAGHRSNGFTETDLPVTCRRCISAASKRPKNSSHHVVTTRQCSCGGSWPCEHAYDPSVMCQARTVAGKRCFADARHGGYCRQHQDTLA